MIINQLTDQISDFKWIARKESLVRNAATQQKIDENYKQLVSQVRSIMNLLKYCKETFNFNLSDTLKEQLVELLDALSKCFYNSLVDEESLKEASKLERKFESDLKNSWASYYKALTSSKTNTLRAVRNINKIGVEDCLTKIEKGASWSQEMSSFKSLKNGLGEADALIENLNLNENIVYFLRKVALQKANITDLTPEILDWIYKENLETKIQVRM